jgi:hypothetical protein
MRAAARLIDFVLLMAAGEAGWLLRLWQLGGEVDPDAARLPHLLSPSRSTLQLAMVGVGVYGSRRSSRCASPRARLVVAVALGVILLSAGLLPAPGGHLLAVEPVLRDGFALIGLFAVPVLLGRHARRRGVQAARAGARRRPARGADRGAGPPRAAPASRSSAMSRMNDGPVAVAAAGQPRRHRQACPTMSSLGASEVVLALEERRNALPLNDLLRIKTTGVHVNELSSFLERETGRVDLDSVNPSWLIFSDGFSSGRRLSSAGKRLFDIVVSLAHPRSSPCRSSC